MNPKKTPQTTDSLLSGLSESEQAMRALLGKNIAPMKKKPEGPSKTRHTQKITEKEDFNVDSEKIETVSKKEYDDTVDKLQRKNDDLAKKNEILKKEKNDARLEVTSLKKIKSANEKKYATLEKKHGELIEENNELKEKIGDHNKSIKLARKKPVTPNSRSCNNNEMRG